MMDNGRMATEVGKLAPDVASEVEPEFLEALIRGHTVAEAAEAAGFSESTAYRRLELPGVRDAVHEARRERLERVMDRAIADIEDAWPAVISTLTDLMNNADDEGHRLRAAQTLGRPIADAIRERLRPVASDGDTAPVGPVEIKWPDWDDGT